jgi:hypothetical protein
LGDGGDESVAAFWDCLYIEWRVGYVPQSIAEFHHRGVQAVVEVDECVGRPEEASEIFPGDEIAGMLEKVDKNPE